ncbi:amidase [Nibrella saemangeumensis]|uniref:Amidase n=1 Tax=Nibrella saemangeumensis TaxID=1084526 RepID=A0ABP8MEW6_9BACT
MQTSSTRTLSFAEYVQHDATSLAELVRKGEVTPAELLETAVTRAEVVNPKINAIVQPLYDHGRALLDKLPADAPFRGVPFLLKDLEMDWEGTPMRSGSVAYRNHVSTRDSEVVKRFKAAGLVFFGKTNTPEFGLTPFTEAKLYGPAHNPWNLNHSTGGSSGGSAAAVAAGIVPAATATDGGGSIRIPAACCGLFGMKPSRGRVTLGPRFGEAWSGAVAGLAVTRSVRDSAALLDAIAGPSIGDPYYLPAPERPFAEEVNREPGRLRIAFTTQHPFPNQKVHAECVKAIHETVKLLESLGHTLEEIALPYTPDILSRTFLTMVFGETAATLREVSAYLNRPARRSDVELATWTQARIGEAYTAGDFAYQKRKWNDLSRTMGHLHETYDVMLTPTLARPPIRIGELQPTAQEEKLIKLVDTLNGLRFLRNSKVIDQLAEKSFGYIPYTPIANMTGQPSMSVPLHWTPDGLPIGSMFTGKLGDEALLYRLAAQVEQAKPWFAKQPNL